MTNSVLPSSIAVVIGGIADANLFHAKVDLGQECTFSKALTEPALITHAGEETLTLTSSALDRSCLMNYGGSITFAGTEPQEVGWIEVRGGDVTVESGTTVNVNSNAFLGAEYPEVARLKLKGKYISDVMGVGIDGGRTFVQCKNTMRGVTEIFDGALVTNAFTAGANNADWVTHKFNLISQVRAMTSFYVYGGEFQANASPHFIGNYRNFFCSMESGLVQFCDISEVRAARWCANTYSAVHQTGGVWKLGDGCDYTFGNCGGVAYHYVTNGTTCVNGSGASMGLGRFDYENNGSGEGSISTLTADGPNALIDLPITEGYCTWRASVQFTKQNKGVSIINLNNGGSLVVNRLHRLGSITTGDKVVTFTNSHAYVGFDGGQLKLAYDFLSESTPVPEIFVNWRDTDDHIWVFGGGAAIDVVADKNRTLGAALETPAGNGIASIDLPAEVANLAASDYTGAPLVTIEDSTGVGASAVALFDTASGKVTGIRVVNRGVGYTAPTVKLVKGGYTNDLVATAHLSANASGGFTKKGAGTLTLDKACSYTGMTAVAEGTLKLDVDNAIGASAVVEVKAGATYDQNGYVSSVPVFGSGAVKGDATAALNWTVDASDLVAGSCLAVDGTLTIPADCVVTVEHPELLGQSSYMLATATTLVGATPSVSGLPTTWKVVYSQSDNTLRLKNLIGTTMLIL